ncbi:MAG: SusD/RagB family nutrient-binding outer membrane lipoprotein, partial [Tannerella sp.]|nr:SusD/RagB family nutrient-binding outer membrane lipoprotein [Tannerella sp.]
YDALPDAEKPDNEAYLLAVETVMYGMTAYIMSSFGDIPFDEIGKVTVTGNIADAHPHYQDDKELYQQVLDKLDELNTKFASAKKPGLFAAQDFVNKGDLAAWRRLANSLRLRAALLVSTQGDLASEGQRVIKEILGDPTGRPIIETNKENICYIQVPKDGSQMNINGGGGFDWVNLKTGSSEIIKRMQKAGDGGVWDAENDDPRVPIFFCLATKNGEFPVNKKEDEEVKEPLKTGRAMPSVFRGASASMSYDTFWEFFGPSETRAYFSRIREHGFFRNNRNWDNPVLTAAELWFIKAEVYQRGWVAGDAKAAFKEGVKLSLEFYMNHHKNKTTDEATSISPTANDRGSNHARAVINPDLSVYNAAWIDAFAEARWEKRIDGTDYSGGKLEAILEQKWLNFGYEYAGEQWNDLRRTGYPRMLYLRDNDPTAEIPFPRNRNRYPSSDRDYNMNFDQVAAQDNYSDVLFWAIKDWHDGPTW